MKTFKNKSIINEGILKSVKAGAESFINDYLEKNRRIKMVSTIDGSGLILNCNNFYIENEAPIWFKTVNNITYAKILQKEIKLPLLAKGTVEIQNSEIESITVSPNTQINTLTITDCDKIEELDLAGAIIENLELGKTKIKTLKGTENVASIYIYKCKRIKEINNIKTNGSVYLNGCKVNKINLDNAINELEIEDVIKISEITINTNNINKLLITDSKTLENIIIKNNIIINTLGISDCGILKNISIDKLNCNNLSLMNLPELEKVDLGDMPKCIAIFKKIKNKPKINCKKIIDK